MTEEEKHDEGAWVPFSELETYLSTVTTSMNGIVANIEKTVENMKDFIKERDNDND